MTAFLHIQRTMWPRQIFLRQRRHFDLLGALDICSCHLHIHMLLARLIAGPWSSNPRPQNLSKANRAEIYIYWDNSISQMQAHLDYEMFYVLQMREYCFRNEAYIFPGLLALECSIITQVMMALRPYMGLWLPLLRRFSQLARGHHGSSISWCSGISPPHPRLLACLSYCEVLSGRLVWPIHLWPEARNHLLDSKPPRFFMNTAPATAVLRSLVWDVLLACQLAQFTLSHYTSFSTGEPFGKGGWPWWNCQDHSKLWSMGTVWNK